MKTRQKYWTRGGRWQLGCALFCLLSVGSAQAGDLYGGASDLPAELRALLQATDPVRRREAVERLEGLEPRISTPYLMQRLADGDSGVRARAAQGLALAAAIEAAPLLLDCVSDVEPPVRAACADAVGQFGSLPKDLASRAAATLARALSDTQYEVRTEALRALGRMLRAQALNQNDLVPLLGPVLLRVEDENVGVRRAAAAVLGRLGALAPAKEVVARVSVALLGQLSDPARDVRTQALISLGELRTAAAAPAALRMLRDPTEEVRRQAVVCLGQLRYPGAVPALIEILSANADSLRGSAAAALGQIARPGPAAPAEQRQAAATAAAELLKALERDELRSLARDALLEAGAEVVPAVCARLQQAGGQSEIGVLVDLLRDLASQDHFTSENKTLAASALTAELWRRRVPREQVLDALAVIHDRSTAPLCAGLLSDHEVTVRRQALVVLRQPGMLDERAVDAVLSATRDSDSEVRLQAVGALGELGGRAAQERLAELLRAGPGAAVAKGGVAPEVRSAPELRAAAAIALGRTAAKSRSGSALSDGALAALVAAVSSPAASAGGASREAGAELRVRRAAASALAQAIAHNPAHRPQVAGPLLAALRKSRAEASESELLGAIGGVLRGSPSEPARELLLSIAQASAEPMSKEAGDALDALDALSAIRDPATAPRLSRLLSHRDPLRRARAAAALGTLLSVAPTVTLVDALAGVTTQEGDPRVVAEAVWALGELATPRGAALLPRVAAALRQVLSRRGDGAAEAAVRANALAALSRIGAPEAGDAMWLTDPDAAVRANAAYLVGILPARSAGLRARLRNLSLVDPDHRVRRNAAVAQNGRATPASGGRTHWLGMYQVDYDRRPLANARFRLTLPDGLVRVGITDHRGIARQELLPDGDCDLETLADSEPGRS